MELSAHICKHTNNLLQTLPLKKGELERLFKNIVFVRVPAEAISERDKYPCEPQRWDPFPAVLWVQDCGDHSAHRTGYLPSVTRSWSCRLC